MDKILARQTPMKSNRYYELMRQYEKLRDTKEWYYRGKKKTIPPGPGKKPSYDEKDLLEYQDEIFALDQAIVDRFMALGGASRPGADEKADRQEWWRETQWVLDQQWQRFLKRVEANLNVSDELLQHYDRQRRQALKEMEAAARQPDYPKMVEPSKELKTGREDFLEPSQYPPEMLADPNIGKVLKAYKATLEAQRKKIAKYVEFYVMAPDSKSAQGWEKDWDKAEQEYARMLSTYKENLDRLIASWKQAAGRAAEAPQSPDPWKDDKEAQAIKAEFDRIREYFKTHYQIEIARAATDPHRQQILPVLKEALASTLADIDRKEQEALEKLKARRAGKAGQTGPAKPKTEPNGGTEPAAAGSGR